MIVFQLIVSVFHYSTQFFIFSSDFTQSQCFVSLLMDLFNYNVLIAPSVSADQPCLYRFFDYTQPCCSYLRHWFTQSCCFYLRDWFHYIRMFLCHTLIKLFFCFKQHYCCTILCPRLLFTSFIRFKFSICGKLYLEYSICYALS